MSKKVKQDSEDSKEGGISNDILEHNILPRLPVKSLFRFKCVSKRLDSLISKDPVFRLKQSQDFKPSSGLLFWDGNSITLLSTDEREMSVPDPSLSFLGNFVSVSNSCNGLICGFFVREDLFPEIYVCNPVTKEVSSVPNPKRFHMVGLAFDPSVPEPHYDLICPYRENKNIHYEYVFHVFSSKTKAWRESNARILVPNSVTGRSFFIDGKLYFRAQHNVVWFHPEEDLAGVTGLPTSLGIASSAVGLYENRLCYTQVTHREIGVWTLNKHDEWEQCFYIPLDIINFFCRGITNLRVFKYMMARRLPGRKFNPMPVFAGDKLLFQVINKVYIFNIYTNEMAEYSAPDREAVSYFICVPYINSFVSLPN